MKKTLAALLCAFMLLSLLTGCGGTKPAAEAEAPAAETEAPAEEAEAPAEETSETADYSRVAGAEDMTTVEEVVEEGMTPVYADSLVDGVYEIAMKSSSSMFKAERCELHVDGSEMTVVLFMKSDAYAYMYAGTAQEAAAADTADYILLSEYPDGTHTFTLPVEALDAGLSFAAFSVRKEMWYDRTLLFRADSLPLDAFAEGAITLPESLGLDDGEYTVEVSLSGGSGRASVTSPAALTVADGVYTVLLEWSSNKYDYMMVDGEKYLPVNTEGNAVFQIPVLVFDANMPVSADTTAMSQPYEIEYTLLFDAASIRPAA